MGRKRAARDTDRGEGRGSAMAGHSCATEDWFERDPRRLAVQIIGRSHHRRKPGPLARAAPSPGLLRPPFPVGSKLGKRLAERNVRREFAPEFTSVGANHRRRSRGWAVATAQDESERRPGKPHLAALRRAI